MADPGRVQSNPSAMELGTTPPQQQHMLVPSAQVTPSQLRVLTTSNSFDSKSNIPSFASRFYMSAEATKLFNTLQQSPLPINSEVNICEHTQRLCHMNFHIFQLFFLLAEATSIGPIAVYE